MGMFEILQMTTNPRLGAPNVDVLDSFPRSGASQVDICLLRRPGPGPTQAYKVAFGEIANVIGTRHVVTRKPVLKFLENYWSQNI